MTVHIAEMVRLYTDQVTVACKVHRTLGVGTGKVVIGGEIIGDVSLSGGYDREKR
jgi:hypothetical protein